MAHGDVMTPDEYVAGLPDGRREAIAAVREVVRANLPPGYVEGIGFGMIGWVVPLERFPDTYNGRPLILAALANQKGYMSLYLNTVYGDPATEAWFRERWATTGKKLDMGKSCVRFRTLDDLPLDVIGETIARVPVDRYVERYRAVRGSSRKAQGGLGLSTSPGQASSGTSMTTVAAARVLGRTRSAMRNAQPPRNAAQTVASENPPAESTSPVTIGPTTKPTLRALLLKASIVPRARSDSSATIVWMPGIPNHVPNAQTENTSSVIGRATAVIGRSGAATTKQAMPTSTVRRGPTRPMNDPDSRVAASPTTPTTT